MYGWLLARVGADLDVMPGEEFRVALAAARAVGAQVVLGDRPLNITLARVWGALSTWEKARLSGSLLWTGLSMLDTEEMRQEIERMKASFFFFCAWPWGVGHRPASCACVPVGVLVLPHPVSSVPVVGAPPRGRRSRTC